MSQTFVFDFLLNDEVLPSAIFYGTIAPLVLYSCARKLLINPYLERERRREADRVKASNHDHLQEKRRQAESVISLWMHTYARIRETESSLKGLVIQAAFYGKASSIDQLALSAEALASPLDPESEVIDVLIPIQCHVKDSRLLLPSVSKVSTCFIPLHHHLCVCVSVAKCFPFVSTDV